MKELYCETFDEVHASERLREEVRNMRVTEQNVRRLRMPAALVAAIVLLVVLAGTVAAVTAGVPGTIREWFTREWTALSGEAMPQEQLSLIQELTQPVGISDTNSGVTVTLDSVTVGQNMLWVLLKVSGTYEAEEAWLYHFADAEMDLDLESSGASAPGIWSMDYAYQGLAEDGTLTMLARFCVDSGMGSLQEGGQVTLRLNDLMCSDTVALRGEWTIPFRLEPVEDQEILTLEELTVPAVDLDTGEQGMVTLHDVRISATELRFVRAAEDQRWRELFPTLVLEDGTQVCSTGGTSGFLDEAHTQWGSVFYWQLPVDMDHVTSIRFRDEVFALR